MKKLLTLFSALVLLAMAQPRQAEAQLLGIDLQFAGDSSWHLGCNVPDTVDLMFWGMAGGYQPNDSIHIEINFGDGSDTSYYVPLLQGALYFQDYFPHTYTLPGAYQVQYIATGPDGAADTLTDPVLVGSSCGDISGTLFVDADGDCIKDPGELPVSWIVRATYNGSEIAVTTSDANGDYFLHVPAGFNYTVELWSSNFTISCPVAGTHTVSTIPSTGNDFALQCVAQADLETSIAGAGFRPGVSRTFNLAALNNLISCAPPTATITLTLDPQLTFDSAQVAPVSVSGQTIVFNVGQLVALNYHQWNIWVAVTASLSTNIGDTLCVTATIDPVVGDADPSNNTYTACLPVRNSFDPNEKHEANVGMGTGNVLPGTILDYTIFFQNLGNDDAINIRIIDELDSDIDLNTLEVTGASHAYTFSLTGNTLQFEFNNINLPAASVHEPASHGYVTYRVYLPHSTPLGTVIDNYASIYFDFNDAIVTNTVTDIVAITGLNDLTKSTFNLYPNPASGYFIPAFEGVAENMSVYDVTGKLVLQRSNVKGGEKVDLKNILPGFYQIVMETEGKVSTAKLTIK